MDLQFINQLKDSCSYILLTLCVINTLLLYLLQTFSLFMKKDTLFKANISQRQHLELAGSVRLSQQGALGSIKPRADPLVAELFVSLCIAQCTS